jgi:hypothetical protein
MPHRRSESDLTIVCLENAPGVQDILELCRAYQAKKTVTHRDNRDFTSKLRALLEQLQAQPGTTTIRN